MDTELESYVEYGYLLFKKKRVAIFRALMPQTYVNDYSWNQWRTQEFFFEKGSAPYSPSTCY